jgi:hypothetical protein
MSPDRTAITAGVRRYAGSGAQGDRGSALGAKAPNWPQCDCERLPRSRESGGPNENADPGRVAAGNGIAPRTSLRFHITPPMIIYSIYAFDLAGGLQFAGRIRTTTPMRIV